MPASTEYDLGSIAAAVITCSDRVIAGAKEDKAGLRCAQLLQEAGLGQVQTSVVAEDRSQLEAAVRQELTAGARLVIILGASGFGLGNYSPEVVRSVIEVEIPGIAEQIRAYGLRSTPLSGLSREVVGVTARDSSGALVLSSPGSVGGASDTLEVLVPLLGAIYSQLDEER